MTPQSPQDKIPNPFRGAICEGVTAFVVALLFLGIFWIHEGIRGARVFHGESLVLVGIAGTAGMFVGYTAFFRLRRLRRLQNQRTNSPEKDPLVASCVASYEDGLEDVTERLAASADIPVWVERVLEERTWNVHRVIVFLRTAIESLDMARLKHELASWVSGNLHGSWMRGLGLGIVLRCSGLHAELEHLYGIVDGCGGPTVILQWFILVDERSRRILAVHMPVSGKTTACFLATLSHLADDGYSLDMALKEKTGLYRKLCAVNEAVPPWLHVLAPFLL